MLRVAARNAFLIGIFVIISCSDFGGEYKYSFVGNPPVMFSEIYTANVDYEDEFGEKPGWVEFYNPADTAFNLKGYSLTNNANEILWTFGDAVVQPKSYLVVFMSGRNRSDLKPPNNVHASFKLNENGGQLFLIASKKQIRDSISYPAQTKDLSFAKNFESGKWMLSKPPTPNSPNSNEFYEEQAQLPVNVNIPLSGYFDKELFFVLPVTEQGIIRCDTTGAVPSENSTLKSGSTLNLTKTIVLRCAQFKNNAYPSEPILRTYIIGERLPNLPVVSIAVDPTDMFDPITGLYSTGLNASTVAPFYGANYWQDTELPIQLDFFENGAKHAWSNFAGIKIFGNYSRVYPKKSVAIGFKGKYGIKKLNYPLFPGYPHLTKFNWFILRNNGGNFLKDYIRDMLMTSLTEGLGIDYQKGRFVIVYYNGKYFGIHGLRERSNKDYFETNYGMDYNFDLLKSKNYLIARSGSIADYQNILQWIESVAMNDNNLKQLGKRIDLDNYTNYLQSEIYFFNKDWPGNNLKMWRSIATYSKWKWLIMDTDWGFGSERRNPEIKMLNFITEPNNPNGKNPPYTTLLIRKLLENKNYEYFFINRFSLLLATYYSPSRVEARINALMNAIESEIPLDQKRFDLDVSTMNYQLTVIRNFGKNRPAEMQKEIEEFFNLDSPFKFTVSAKGNGKILVHNLPVLNGNATFWAYPSVPLIIKAVPSGGAKFSKWSDGVKDAERTVTVKQAMSLTAEFM